MRESAVNRMKAYIGFDDADAARIKAVASRMDSCIDGAVDRFYEQVLKDQVARAVFTGGEEQIERQRKTLTHWMQSLFEGPYDAEYFESRAGIGVMHVRSGVPQHYMVTGIEVVWQELEKAMRRIAVPDLEETLRSVHKLLSLELAVMVEGYKDRYSELVRHSERSAVEEKLTRAEHLAEIGQLAASLAHEIKNPLAGISGAIQIMRDEMHGNDPKQPIVTEILDQIRRLDATVKDLLQYARPTPPRLVAVSLNRVVDRVLKFLQGEPALQRIRVQWEGPSVDVMIEADDGQIEQLLINLILNAAQASEDNRTIHVGMHLNGGFVRLLVKDEGVGMTKEIRRHAFEPFFTTKARGTGLGLSICRRIVEVHGGTILLESERGAGTTVVVDLLRKPEEIIERIKL